VIDPATIRALTFDVFGTVVDWRSGVIRDGEALARAKGIQHVDWGAFAAAWRGRYLPAMQRVRTGERPWTTLDVLHRESLQEVLAEFDVGGLADGEIDDLNRVWHRLDPWPDAVEGLTRLRRRYVLATLSNGNVALMVDMAKRAALPWDAILGAEVARHYKPDPETYLTTAAMLGASPEACLMVAAHGGDLAAAGACGFRTAYVSRPDEYGPRPPRSGTKARPWDVVASDFLDLADRLGC
jgi:2-haloacid dehalogenase